MNRRKLLSTIAGGSAIGLAGCSSILNNGIRLGAVGLLNFTGRDLTVSARVEYEGEIVEEGAYELGPNRSMGLDCTWPDEPGQFVIAGRLPDDDEWDEWIEHDVSEDADSDCTLGVITYRSQGVLAVQSLDDCDFQPGKAWCNRLATDSDGD